MLTTALRAVGSVLDGIEIGFCAFDAEDRTLVWNTTFLVLFPEHAGFLREGEPYAENLRRYYAGRLVGDERALIDRYIADGVERHRSQRRPFDFEHRGQVLRVSSLEMGTFGRLRTWRKLRDTASGPRPPPAPPPAAFDAAAGLLLERIADGVLVVDIADRALWANRAFLELYGLASVDDAVGRRFDEIYRGAWQGDAESPAFRRSALALRENQRFSGAPYELALPDERWVRVVEQRGGEADLRGYFLHADITALKRQQRALREAEARARDNEARYRLLAEYSSDVTAAVADGTLSYVSPAVTEVLGWSPEQVIGRSVESLCHPDDLPQVATALQTLRGASQADYRARVQHADGSWVWIEARARLARATPERPAVMLVVNARSIAARKLVEDELAVALARLEELAVRDGLTGLYNRRHFDEMLAAEWRRAYRDNAPLALLLIDLDHFKLLNDTHGHPAGDEVLRRLATVFASFGQRAGDVVARYGGEEFTVLLPNTDRACAAAIAEKVRAAASRLDRSGMTALPAGAPLSISIGVACAVGDQLEAAPDELVRRADAALYAAKRGGRDRVVVADDVS
jgi:diguanylate cyclase (GGDEF)-like protein/PAS domain S-box-containing protein